MFPEVEVPGASRGSDGPTGDGTDPAVDRDALLRRLGWAALVVVVVPVWVAVVRAGVGGLYPYADGAETVLRALDVFDGPFPLAGMSAAGGSQGGTDVYFPGAWQLYVIALPTRVLGTVWGPLVAMGILNTLWIVLAGWLLLRRLRPVEALVGIGFLATFVWSVGSGFLITPIPMEMVLVPTATLLIAVWAVADGDPVAAPVLALVANFLWLDHLVLVVTVPVLVACAVVGSILWFRRERHEGEASVPRRRRMWRGVIVAGAITVVMWIPTIVQQLTVRPGNLWQLFANVGAERPVTATWWSAAHDTMSVIGRPPFWFRGSLDNPDFAKRPTGWYVGPHLTLHDLVLWVVVVGALVGLGIVAHRRRDRTGLWLLIVAGVAVAVSVVTTRSAPNYLSIGPPMGYIRASWAVAMFVWFAVVVNLVRLARGRMVWAAAGPALVLVVVCTVANLPVAADGYGTDARTNRIVDEINRTVPGRLAGRGTFELAATSFRAHVFSAALALRLTEAGVPTCYRSEWLLSDGSRAACPADTAGTLVVEVDSDTAHARAGEMVFSGSFLTDREREEVAGLDETLARWLASVDRIVLSSAAEAEFDHLLADDAEPVFAEPFRRVLDARGDRVEALLGDPAFVAVVAAWYTTRGVDDPPLFSDAPLSATQWRRWMKLRDLDRSVTVRVP